MHALVGEKGGTSVHGNGFCGSHAPCGGRDRVSLDCSAPQRVPIPDDGVDETFRAIQKIYFL